MRSGKPEQKELSAHVTDGIDKEKILEVLDQLTRSPAGLNQQLMTSMSYMTAYHHAGTWVLGRGVTYNGL